MPEPETTPPAPDSTSSRSASEPATFRQWAGENRGFLGIVGGALASAVGLYSFTIQAAHDVAKREAEEYMDQRFGEFYRETVRNFSDATRAQLEAVAQIEAQRDTLEKQLAAITDESLEILVSLKSQSQLVRGELVTLEDQVRNIQASAGDVKPTGPKPTSTLP